ncbi:unnamed protein product [Auanema sp. JU1783]|nr:unnamed protein product [Auanema sp. JU1783]
MLIKEYRILLPMTVDEYRIAQLYMIQKKSRLDSHGKDSGVEIITNKPYYEGPGGQGQYTFKIYHIGSKIPGWIRTVLPTNALEAHEEAWNAYPLTKTRYSTPMMDRVSVEVETVYINDEGNQENVFNLSEDELKTRIIDVMDFVKDPISAHDYCIEEDPKLYKSQSTGRGPLADDWVQEHIRLGKPIMCAYKLCRVEFKYWGLQTRAERWIHDLALRGTMLRAHRQAWAWQDEWVGLTMKDIRHLEAEAALHLSAVMATGEENKEEDEMDESEEDDDLFYDCIEGPSPGSKPPSIIRWSSEVELDHQDEGSPPATPSAAAETALLVLVFHGDFSPENPADSKTTDTNTFKSTIDSLINRHYPQLKGRVHIQLVSCGRELSSIVSKLTAISPSFGLLHPSLSLILSSAHAQYNEAIEGTIRRANDTYIEYLESQPSFSGEVFVVGDSVGGLFLYEAMTTRNEMLPLTMTRHSSSVSTRTIPEGQEETASSSFVSRRSMHEPRDCSSSLDESHEHIRSISVFHQTPVHQMPPRSPRTLSAPPSAGYTKKKISIGAISVDSINITSRLAFHPANAFLLGCPLGLVLTQRKLAGLDVENLDSCQLFNLYYPFDPCGSRVEPVLNSQLNLVPPANIPKYQRYPLGDGKNISFDSSIDLNRMWGTKRMDHVLYCPNAMIALPSTALPNILHASYWESLDVAAFILRQFVRGEEAILTTLSASMNSIPMNLPLPPMQWRKRRTRFKTANLSPNHRANDVLVINGLEQNIHAKFFYGPMDLVALTRESVTVYVCPQRGDWYKVGTYETDSHGRLHLAMPQSLPCGVHNIKIVVHGDRSYLDVFLAVVPKDTRCVVFSVDGSLTASISVTGKDPKVRPGAVDVVRYWHEQGYVIIYLTARPDMQQRALSAWLAHHNFPHGLLFFNASFSTEPLRQKTMHLKQLIDMSIRIHVAYGSGKDVAVYTGAGVDPDRIISVSGGRRRNCTFIDNYSHHLADLTAGNFVFSQRNSSSADKADDTNSLNIPQNHRNIQRTSSFSPRAGKLENDRR